MQPDPKRGDSRRDFAVQRAILAVLLAGDPVPRTTTELAREIGDREAVERAVAALEDCGLLEIRGGESAVIVANACCPSGPSPGGVVSMDVAARFGDNLRRQRRLADLSQDDLAFRGLVAPD